MLGEALGSYQIVRRLGAGGMGTVFLGEHSLIGRKAAIKVLNPEYSHNTVVVHRFFTEAKAATAVRHPGIIEIYDFGYDKGGRAYIVMEYLEGESLKARMRRLRWLPETYVLNFTRQIAGALSAAHGAGIVHRDLKPDNLYVITDPDMPGGERIKILDFGIAKFADEGTGPSIKTRTGVAMGTPAYMSPEQCKGAGRVDHRADLYALGCVMFELLTGSPPFVAEGGGEVMAQHIYEPVPSALAKGAEIATETDRIIEKLLAKERGQRFQNAAELIKAIDESCGRLPRAITADEEERDDEDDDGLARRRDDTEEDDRGGLRAEDITTLNAAAGETSPSEKLFVGASRWRARAAAAAAVVAAVALAVVAVRAISDASDRDAAPATAEPTPEPVPARSPPVAEPPPADTPAPPAPVVPEEPPLIAVEILSHPAGASVYRMPAGVRVGKTPYMLTAEPMAGELEFVIQADGHDEQTVVVPADASSRRLIELEPVHRRTARRERDRERDRDRPRVRKSAPPRAEPARAAPADRGKSLNPFERKPAERKPAERSLDPFARSRSER